MDSWSRWWLITGRPWSHVMVIVEDLPLHCHPNALDSDNRRIKTKTIHSTQRHWNDSKIHGMELHSLRSAETPRYRCGTKLKHIFWATPSLQFRCGLFSYLWLGSWDEATPWNRQATQSAFFCWTKEETSVTPFQWSCTFCIAIEDQP